MCNPAIAAAAFAVGSVGMQYGAARAEAKHQDQVYEVNRQQAFKSMGEQYQGIGLRQLQNTEAAADEIWNRRLQALREQSTSAVAAGEAGISGFTVERVLRDIGATASRDVSTIERNRDWNNQQLQSEAMGVKAQAADRILSVQRGTPPNPWASVFKAGSDGLSAYKGAGGKFGK